MNEETKIQRGIMIAANSRDDMRLFRNNVAKIHYRGRWLSFGIPGKGGSDLIGWKRVKITPDMVGEDVAVFTSVEVKTPKGRPTKEQKQWLELVESFGGIALIARGKEDLPKKMKKK